VINNSDTASSAPAGPIHPATHLSPKRIKGGASARKHPPPTGVVITITAWVESPSSAQSPTTSWEQRRAAINPYPHPLSLFQAPRHPLLPRCRPLCPATRSINPIRHDLLAFTESALACLLLKFRQSGAVAINRCLKAGNRCRRGAMASALSFLILPSLSHQVRTRTVDTFYPAILLSPV
jgi:hypothetical protein